MKKNKVKVYMNKSDIEYLVNEMGEEDAIKFLTKLKEDNVFDLYIYEEEELEN
tara:strand:+ start:515 stop:673 length:159 start_codon:yes stop_codon:yes gene_type:complete